MARAAEYQDWQIEIPIGLASVHLVLLSTAIVNLFTKQVATVAGLAFSSRSSLSSPSPSRSTSASSRHVEQQMKEHFQLLHQETIGREAVQVRPGNVLVTVRDYNTLNHLRWALENTDTHDTDIVVMEARLTGYGSAESDLAMEQIFSDYEQTLFTKAVSIAEGYGKTISLLVVPARDVWSAIVQTANAMESSAVVSGLSSKMTGEEQAFRLGQAWEAMPEPKRQFVFQVVRPDSTVETYRIGPHTPTMKTEDVHLVHKIWLEIKRVQGTEDIHHSDIVTLALTRLSRDYNLDKDDVLKNLKKGVRGAPPTTASFVREPDTEGTQKRTEAPAASSLCRP